MESGIWQPQGCVVNFIEQHGAWHMTELKLFVEFDWDVKFEKSLRSKIKSKSLWSVNYLSKHKLLVNFCLSSSDTKKLFFWSIQTYEPPVVKAECTNLTTVCLWASPNLCLFNCCVLFHCMEVPKCVYSFTHWSLFQLSPGSVNCGSCCYKHSCTGFYMYTCLHSSKRIPRSELARSNSKCRFNF